MKTPDLAPSEALLDAAVELTFPASDPVSVTHAFKAATLRERNARRKALLPAGRPRAKKKDRA